VAETLAPRELRLRFFAALRELFRRLAERVPLLLVIDDLQWSDDDSDQLLAEILRAPDAPRLLLLATSRTAPRPGRRVHALRLERLPPPDARELAQRLQAALPGDERLDPAAIAAEADGHPLFIAELVRHARSRRATPPDLDEAIWTHLGTLDATARGLLELVAIAGGPIAQATTATAAAIGLAELGRHVTLLRARHLVRTTGADANDAVEPYHDRIREAVLLRLDEGRRRARHASLAHALAANENAEPELLAMHWAQAGAPAQAAEHALRAAEKARRALAFDREARLISLALELAPPDADRARDLHTRRGDALVNATRGPEAAEAYLQAAAGSAGTLALDLRRQAAEQLIITGHVDAGLATIEGVLRGLRVRAPRSRWGMVLSLLYRRARIRLRGLRFRRRSEAESSPDDLARMNVYEAIGRSLMMLDNVRAADFQARLLLLALRCGIPARVAQAVGLEAVHSSMVGRRAARRTGRLLRATQVLAEDVGEPYVHGVAASAAGSADFLGAGRWRSGRAHFERALTISESLPGVRFERTSLQMGSVWAMYVQGDVTALARQVPAYVREADERGDILAGSLLRTLVGNAAWLVVGDPAEAQRQVAAARQLWGDQRHELPPLFLMVAEGHIELYLGRGATALEKVRSLWRPMLRSYVLHVQFARFVAFDLRARAALAAYDATSGRELLGEAEHFTRKLEREKTACTDAMAALLRAGLAARRGAPRLTCELLGRAAAQFDAADMAMHAAVARGCHGCRIEGDEGRALGSSFRQWMAGQGVPEPERLAAMLAPGLPA
jgi:hypothetical protein